MMVLSEESKVSVFTHEIHFIQETDDFGSMFKVTGGHK